MSGVLSNSSVIRNKHLQQNLSLYEAYDGTSKGLSYYTFNTKPLKRINEGSLYDYTHNELTEYSKNIGHLYFKHRPDFQPYINIDPINPQNFWGGEYHDYYDYVNAVYTQISPPIQFIEGLLSTQFLDEAIRVTSPAIVHNPEPTLSMAGVVKTNVNNFSGTDTRTGLLGNQMYAHALYHGANFNTMRKGATTFVENHITPTAYIRFGNSNYTINSLSSIVSAIRDDGRIVEDYNQGIGVIHDISQLYQDVMITKLRRSTKEEKAASGEKFTEETFEVQDLLMFDINTRNLFKTLNLNKQFNAFNADFVKYTGADEIYINEDSNEGETNEGESNDGTQNAGEQTIVSFNLENGVRTTNTTIKHGVYAMIDSDEDGDNYYEIEGRKLNPKSILKKTHDLFNRVRSQEEEIYTNLGFEKFNDCKFDLKSTTITDTSTSIVGRSRGRNLLKKEYNDTGEDGTTTLKENPFCRTWTYYHQYNKMDRLIRPFEEDAEGDTYLKLNTVLNKNGMVNIAPSKTGKVDIKKCMFSIENLAWKDVLQKEAYLSNEQRGPNGGRIMWFPPYDLNFSENTNVSWEGSTFIGRGEKVYTYSNTDRTGSLSFTLLIDHPSMIHNIYTEDGNVKNNITDDDILRFFAGCQQLYKEEKIIEEEGGETPKDPDPELGTETKYLFVYFPNNYSGHYNTTVKKGEDTTTPPDSDFIDYMVYGYNATIDTTDDANKKRGYEMSSKGLSITDTEEGTFCGCNPSASAYKECKKEFTDSYRFYYRTDFDLKQHLSASSRKDTTSSQLNTKSSDGNFSFANLVYAIKKQKNEGFDKFNEYMKGLLGEESFESFKNQSEALIELLNSDTIIDINLVGSATKQDSKNSKMLANRRGGTLKSLISSSFSNLKDKFTITESKVSGNKNDKGINGKDIKGKRYSCIEIKYQISKTETVGNTLNEDKKEKTDKSKKVIKIVRQTERYENEAQYFSKLQKEDSFLYNKLTTKFKYFTPAFHSVSPEGFNARLTFLQQCTRQGHTIETSTSKTSGDKPAAVAGNLAFGRMPVCILRIGDFIYSRILITSMSINYGDNQWDLNPEGIGVQPMMAKVNLGITILGGQSLEGPISRLQNAISFNHYANAGVYDDRADKARPTNKKNEWSTDYYYTWQPKQ